MHVRSSGEVERERVRPAPGVGRWESPGFDLVANAAFGLGGARATPGAIGDVDARDVAAARERDRDRHRTSERRIRFQAILLIAEAKLRLAATNELTKLADVASIATDVLGVNRRRRRHAHAGARDPATGPDAPDTPTPTAAGSRAAADAAPSRRPSALT